jgi:hypothetical protein
LLQFGGAVVMLASGSIEEDQKENATVATPAQTLTSASAYDGDWDAYLDDFGTKIPDSLDIIFSAFEGSPGIRSPEVKDWIAKRQVTAEGWYVAHPDLTVRETRRLKRSGKAVDEFLN